MTAIKVPIVCTTEQGIRQGAVFGVGPPTSGKVFATIKAAGIAGVSMPANATPI